MAMSGAEYKLKLQATLDTKGLEGKLEARINQLKSKGLTNIRIRTTWDGQDMTKGVVRYTDAAGKAQVETLKWGKSVDGNRVVLKRLRNETAGVTKGTNFFTKALGSAAITAIKYSLGLGLIYKAMAQIGEGIQYIKDLDKEMRDIQIVTGYADETIESLAGNYNELAKAMGATTLEVAQGSLEWTRQGKTIEETQELLRSTLMLSKLGNVETAQATEYLTSILNGFKLEASDTESVVSKLVAVDNAAATSVKELATALQKGSVSAQKAGVDLDELIAYVGTVSSVTRQSAERIGTAFRTMFARFQDVKSGALDDTEDSLNNVEAALRRVEAATGKSIPMVNRQTGQFRDFSDVLEDLYSVWDDLNEIEQANISKALAGVRQREVLLALMENEEMMRGLLAEAMNSEGLAADRYSIYLEGLAAAQNKAKASWEGMWQATLENDLIKTFYEASSAVLDFIEMIGGLDTILISVVAGIAAYALGMGVLNVATGGLTLAWEALTVAMATNPIGLIAIAIGLVTAAIIGMNSAVNDAEDALSDELQSAVSNFSSSTASAKSVVDEFTKSLDEMNKSYKETPWHIRMFVDEQALAMEQMERFTPLLLSSASSAEEYNKALKDMAIATGYVELADGSLSRVAKSGAGYTTEAFDATRFLNEEQWKFIQQNPAMVDGFVAIAAAGGKATEEVEKLSVSFQKMLEQIFYDKDTGSIDERFRGLYDNLTQVTELYEDGIIDTNAYFTQLQEAIDRVDISELFSEEDGATKRAFLEGLTENTLTAFDAINGAFESGELSMTQYTEQLAGWGETLISVTDMAAEMGILSAEAVASSLGEISGAVGELTRALELNAAVEESLYQMAQGHLAWETAAYAERARMLGVLAQNSGMVIKDMEGNVLEGAKNITGWLMQSEGNLGLFSNQVASKTGIAVNDLVRAAGKTLQELSKSIGSLKADITFVPHINNNISLGAMLQNWISGGGLQLPSFGYTVQAEGSVTQPAYDGWMAGAGLGRDEGTSGGLLDAFGSIGDLLADSNYGLDWDSSIYDTTKLATEAYDNFADTIGSVTNAFQDMAGSSNKAQKAAAKDAKTVTALLAIVVDKIKQEAKARKDSLKEALAGYKKLIKTRKDLLDTMQDEEKYQKKLASKQRGLTRIQSEIEELRLDDSEEAAARRRALEEEAVEMQDEIAEDQADRSVELQKDALDEEYEAFKENIEAQIDLIDKYLSEPGRIVADALSLIEGKGKNLYASLIEWNSIYGTGIKNDIVTAWGDAYKALSKYGGALAAMSAESSTIPSYHTGGIVGSGRGGSGEVVAKLLTGELVSTRADMDNFISRILPSMLGAAVELSGGAGVSVDTFMELNVAGNLDSSVVPQIDKIAMRAVEKMTEIMQSRGHVRRAQQFQI